MVLREPFKSVSILKNFSKPKTTTARGYRRLVLTTGPTGSWIFCLGVTTSSNYSLVFGKFKNRFPYLNGSPTGLMHKMI